jgi:hypothetical protein
MATSRRAARAARDDAGPMIGVTTFTFAFLPLLLATQGRPERLLLLVVTASVFDSASVLNLNLGSLAFGVQPAFAAASAFIGVMLLRRLSGQTFGGEGRVSYVFFPLLLFCICAMVSALLLPRLFQGTVYVWPERVENGFENLAVPLMPNSGNVTQAVYLLVAVLLCIFGCVCAEARPNLPERLLKTYFWSGIIAALIGFWQWTGKFTGLYFPHDFFFSNPSWADNTDETFGAVWRISGTFAEPSFFCFYLAGPLYASGWSLLASGPSRLAGVTFAATFLAAVLSTSTTGYVVIAIGAALAAVRAIRAGGARRRLALAVAGAVLLLLAGSWIVERVFPQIVPLVEEIVSDTLGKTDSESFEVRSRQDRETYAVVFDTFGLGAGWGSVRASSLVTTLIGATGLWGLALLAWAGWRVVRSCARARPHPGEGASLGPLVASVMGMLVAAAASKPDLAFVGFWVNLAAAVGVSLRLRSRHAAHAPHPSPIRIPVEARS